MSLIFRRSWTLGEDVEMSSHFYVSRLGGPRWQQTHFCTVSFSKPQGNTGLLGLDLYTALLQSSPLHQQFQRDAQNPLFSSASSTFWLLPQLPRLPHLLAAPRRNS